MYSIRQGLILGFHGCDRQVAEDVINSRSDLRQSINSYDWLGHGVYFWENSVSRAMEFAEFLKENPGRSRHPIKDPAVIGAVIHPGFCFDLVDYQNLCLLKSGFEVFKSAWETSGKILPANRNTGSGDDLLLRDLDCAVIEVIHQIRKESDEPQFDSVRGVFWEGDYLYPNAGFKQKNHVQLCVRNPNCIKGYFLPRSLNSSFSKV